VSKLEYSMLPHVPMSRLQRQVLARLANKAPDIVPHRELLTIWPDRSQGALNMVLYGLRKKVRPEGYDIVSHRGVGYSLTPPPSG
jgi:DNA-binding winged helix-turn-helix (wHTH) protein